MKTIGVLGGLGPQATMDFEARLHAVSQQLIAPPKEQRLSTSAGVLLSTRAVPHAGRTYASVATATGPASLGGREKAGSVG